MDITIYKVILFVENDICSWIVQACQPAVAVDSWYTHSVSNKAYTSLQYNEAIADAAAFIWDKRHRVPVYHHGVKNPIEYLFETRPNRLSACGR